MNATTILCRAQSRPVDEILIDVKCLQRSVLILGDVRPQGVRAVFIDIVVVDALVPIVIDGVD